MRRSHSGRENPWSDRQNLIRFLQIVLGAAAFDEGYGELGTNEHSNQESIENLLLMPS